MTYWFVKVNGKWSRPYTYYPVSKYLYMNADVEIYEINLDTDLKKKQLVWKSKNKD